MYADQQTDVWKQRYKIRSGIEATMSELKRSHAIGKSQVQRSVRVCFAVACKAIACTTLNAGRSHVRSRIMPYSAFFAAFMMTDG